MIIELVRPVTNTTKESVIRSLEAGPDIIYAINGSQIKSCKLEIRFENPVDNSSGENIVLSENAIILVLDDYIDYDETALKSKVHKVKRSSE